MSISFGFKKKIENKVTGVQKSKDEEQLDYLKTVEDKLLKSDKPVAEKKELIIPLIRKNVYKKPSSSDAKAKDKKSTETNETDDEIQAAAVKEIMEESATFMEKAQKENEDENLSVPLLMRNKVPDGFETDERLDVSLRPDEASEADYEQIPIASFGMAVLRGMGWTPEEGIGRTFKQNTTPLEQRVRPKGLGLGAEVAVPINETQKKSQKKIQNNEEKLVIEKGSHVFIHSGSLKNKYGTVQGVDIETARCIIKLAIGGKSEQVGQHSLRAVSKREYEQNAKYLGKLKKDDSGTQILGNGFKGEERVASNSPSSSKRKREEIYDKRDNTREEEERDGSYRREKKKHKKSKKDKKNSRHEKSSPVRSWVRPQMRTRIIDESYRKGRYYLEKVIIEDVLGNGRCCCKTEKGQLLDDIKDSMLETVIPKSNSNVYVIIVRQTRGAKHDGKLAKILEKDKSRSKALVQLIEDRDIVLKLNFEEICEYTGDVEADVMF